MENNMIIEAGRKTLTELVREDKLEGLAKAAAYFGLGLLELAKLLMEAKQAKKQL